MKLMTPNTLTLNIVVLILLLSYNTVVLFHILSLEASYLSSFGGGNGSIFLDNVECNGDEERVDNCTHNGIGHHDCHTDHSEDAGVFCDLSKLIIFWKI